MPAGFQYKEETSSAIAVNASPMPIARAPIGMLSTSPPTVPPALEAMDCTPERATITTPAKRHRNVFMCQVCASKVTRLLQERYGYVNFNNALTTQLVYELC